MRYESKHIKYTTFAGILLLLGIMFVLNKHYETQSLVSENEQHKIEMSGILNSGLSSTTYQFPTCPEAALPLKLIHKPALNLVVVLCRNYSIEIKKSYIQLENTYLSYSHNLLSGFLCVIIKTSRNKDIR